MGIFNIFCNAIGIYMLIVVLGLAIVAIFKSKRKK